MAGKMKDDLLQYLLAIGAMEYVKDDKNGIPIYRLTKDAKELVPQLYDEHMKDFHTSVFSLWSKDLINLIFNDEGEPLIGLNNNSTNIDKITGLPSNEREALDEMLEYWEKEIEE